MASSDEQLFEIDAAERFASGRMSDEESLVFLKPIDFRDGPQALRRFRKLAQSASEQEAFGRLLPMLLHALAEAASADSSLVNFERFAEQQSNRLELYRKLIDQPRAVEILVKLFVGSQFLTEILLRNQSYLDRLTQHQRLPEIKSRERFAEECRKTIGEAATFDQKLAIVRKFQQWELLRLAACDTFGLMDLKAVTLQLSLLADAMTQVCLELTRAEVQVPADDFVVLAFGKLGGEELNYSSDLDLVFLCQDQAERYWGIGQKLIRMMTESSVHGFMYRVDMRLRPWGKSGPLVCTVDAYLDYLKKHGQLWEKQALLKARPIAGNLTLGYRALQKIDDIIFDVDPNAARENVRSMKETIEEGLAKSGRAWGQVKGGKGSIRDVEFLTQYLQLAYGGDEPMVRSKGTLDGLIRLAEFDFIQADEYRQLTSGYVFLRTIEHSLQLMHNQAEHALPEHPRELAYLAGRLDFPDAATFVQHYERHCRAVRDIYEKYIFEKKEASVPLAPTPAKTLDSHLGEAAASYQELFTKEQTKRHLALFDKLDEQHLVRIQAISQANGMWELAVVGYDQLGDLSAMCGLLLVYRLDIESGFVLTGAEVPERKAAKLPSGVKRRKFVNVFQVRPERTDVTMAIWAQYEKELSGLMARMAAGHAEDVQGRLARRVAQSMDVASLERSQLLPVSITVDNDSSADATVLHIRADDTPGFLYELTNALTLTGVSIQKVFIHSERQQVLDTLYVTDQRGNKITDFKRQNELRAAVVLIKHFTHLLPQSPNPETALLHFRDFLEQLFEQPDWLSKLASLHRTEVLEGLSRMMGMSDFLWADFLKLQHDNLFPVIADVAGLQHRKSLDELNREIQAKLCGVGTLEQKREILNSFKDREMLRVDMRHIVGAQPHFMQFSKELTDIAEAVVNGAVTICLHDLLPVYGHPLDPFGSPCRYSICALGKCGGRELGFASDIELLFLYDCDGETAGPKKIGNTEFFDLLIEGFRRSISARRAGVFEVDLRLRPFGRAGSLAVALDSFERYFGPNGPAWPFERQALVRLRPIGGAFDFGKKVIETRDRLIYTGRPFDVAAMRAMRQKQITQHVTPGTFNAKLSPGGLVDIEYLIQGLQMTYGARSPTLRVTNTREAMKALEWAGILTTHERLELRDCYRFLRRLIDALRIVRGDARDLTVPPPESDEFQYLVRRMQLFKESPDLLRDIEFYTGKVRTISERLLTTLRVLAPSEVKTDKPSTEGKPIKPAAVVEKTSAKPRKSRSRPGRKKDAD
jgi:glutamate-ammonia-ligase adenylyltransferase